MFGCARNICQDLSCCPPPSKPIEPASDSPPEPTNNLKEKQPTPETHPKVKFWNKSDWMSWISLPANYKASKTSFLEGTNGNQLDTQAVNLICDSMRLAWNDLIEQKHAPSTWKQATAAAHQSFYSYMEDKWPLLKLCNNRWKLDKLASITYLGYK